MNTAIIILKDGKATVEVDNKVTNLGEVSEVWLDNYMNDLSKVYTVTLLDNTRDEGV